MGSPGVNDIWNILYSTALPPEQMEQECDFIEYFIPRESHPSLLDLACETGAHSIEMAARGYRVTGIDVDPKVVQVAQRNAERRGVDVRFIEADLRDLNRIDDRFDGIILFWRSFGFFDDTTQIRIFSALRQLLRPEGRLILDLYNRLHFTKGVEPHRYLVEAQDLPLPIWNRSDHARAYAGYGDLHATAQRDTAVYNPNLFTPGEISAIAASNKFHLIASCSDFSPTMPATYEHPRMQLVFERR